MSPRYGMSTRVRHGNNTYGRLLRMTLRTLAQTGVVFLCAACNTPYAATKLMVPVHFQEEHQCGPAALAMVLNFYGHDVQPQTLTPTVYLPALQGTTPQLLAEVARHYGFEAAIEAGDKEHLEQWLLEGIPPIVFLGNRDTYGHFVVVTGLSARRIRMHNGQQQDTWMKQTQFLDQWRHGRNTALLIFPRDN